MKRIGVIVNTKRLHSERTLEELGRLAKAHDLKLFAEDQSLIGLLGAAHLAVEEFAGNVDIALAMGGDGTVLYTARALHGSDIPILGVNLGSLGFLTSVGDVDLEPAVDAIISNKCQLSSRMVAECRIYPNGEEVCRYPALNDIVLGWGASSRIVTLRLSVNGEQVGSFMCDGMLVSTPTGSTGHALSSGGPILHPGVAGFGINVICAHTLSSRPLVIPDTSLIEIEVVNAAKELILSIDGQDEFKIEQGARIAVEKSAHPVQFLQLPGFNYFSVLAQKLHWRGSSL